MDKNRIVEHIETALGAGDCAVSVHRGIDFKVPEYAITISVYWKASKQIYSRRFGSDVLPLLTWMHMAEQFISEAQKKKLV